MEKGREELIDLMIRYKRIKSHDIVVVFDGHIAGRGQESTIVRGGVAVIFSGLGEKADEVIKRIITKDRKEWIVVSSDKEIIRCAWSVNSVPVPSEDFIGAVSRGTAGEGIISVSGHEAAMPEDAAPHSGKGNPYKLSKKEKSVRRALSKL